MSDNPAKAKYALDLLSSFDEMRQGNIICDFAIKVGGESFPVHRAVLAASSKYFRGMLQSGMIEVQRGYIDMQDAEAIAVKICVKYMYSGEAELVLASFGSTVKAAHLMQLDGLVDACFIYLQNNISAENCVSIISLSRLYDRHDLEHLAVKYLSENLSVVSSFESFSTITKDDFIRYLNESTSSYKVLWEALTSWIYPKQEDCDDVMAEVMGAIKIRDFPFEFLFDLIQDCDLVKNSPAVRVKVLQAMFSKDVRSKITPDNLFTLRKLMKKSRISEKEEMKQINDAMLEKFEDVTEKDEFVHLDEDEILMLLRSPETKCSSEEIKWKAILKWSKNVSGRKKSFSKLFKLLQLGKMSKEFIRNNIRIEPMVKESAECMDLILEVALDQSTDEGIQEEPLSQKIALLQREDGGIVWVFDEKNDVKLSIVRRLKGMICQINSGDKRGMVSLNGELYIMVNENLFRLRGDGDWIQLPSLPAMCESWPKMTTLDGHIYALTGSKVMACYRPINENWTVNLPGYGVDPVFCVVSSRRILISMGGKKEGNVTNEVKEYDPKTNNWSNMTPMLKNRSGASAAMLREMIIVTGGQDESGSALASVECYVPLTRSWTMLANMNTPRRGHSMFPSNNTVYVCGGDKTPSGKRKCKGTIEVFHEGDGKWKIVAEKTGLAGTLPSCEFQSR